MSCKDCNDVTLLAGNDGVGIQTIVNNGDGTFTIFLTNGTTFTTDDFTGAPGAAATIALDTPPALIGAPGTDPTVVNNGTSSAAVFQFTFPIGIAVDNSLFVDAEYGDVTTALRERIDLPYPDIRTALAAAQSGDTVFVRPGSFTEDIYLTDDVNIHFESGAILNGTIQVQSNNITASITGHGILQNDNTAENCILVVGNNCDIEVNFKQIINEGTCILQRAIPGESNKLLVQTDILSGNIQNYFVSVGGNVDCTVIINDYVETQSTFVGPFSGVTAISGPVPNSGGISSGGFAGTLNFKCPKITIGTSTNTTSGIALYVGPLATSDARIFFEVDQIINNYDLSTQDPALNPNAQNVAYGTLSLNGSGTYIIKVKDCYSKSRVGLMVGGLDNDATITAANTGTVIFEGNIFSQKSAAVRQFSYESQLTGQTKLIIKNSSLMRGSDDTATGSHRDRNTVVILGNAGFGTVPLGTLTNRFINVEFINTEIIKDRNTTVIPAGATDNGDGSVDNSLIAIQGYDAAAAGNILFKSCDIIGGIENQTFSGFAVAGFTNVTTLDPGTNADVYFKDTHSNDPLKTGAGAINETNSGGSNDGFVEEAACQSLNYLHKS